MPQCNKIKVMSESLAIKIAAGEVIERPASVVKELVENSIDAKATEISIHIRDGGRKLIKVVDNGEGMTRDDAVTAFQRHATSKLLKEEDLYSISTMGFRGGGASEHRIRIRNHFDDKGFQRYCRDLCEDKGRNSRRGQG